MGTRVGVIGAGRIGKLHAENIAHYIHNAQLAAISDIVSKAAEDVATELKLPIATQDYREILQDDSISAVLICSSTDTHARIIQEAAAAGKHIFCEKPIDLDLSRIKNVLEKVRESDVKLQVGFNRRFDHNFAEVKNKLRNGEIGDPHLLRITSRDPTPPPMEYVKVSGGIF